jgi:hypothetical protein
MLRQRELRKIFENLAASNWQLAISQTNLFNHKGHPFDSPFACSGSLRAG